jgi:molybdate transport system ATP-binding protein
LLHVEAATRLGDFDLDVSLAAAPGQCLALAGPSGAGKSTILRIIAGLHRPDRGVVACGGTPWLDTASGIDVAPEHRRCGYVFQDYALFEHLSAWQNVAYGLRELPRAERRPRALELLERLGLAARADARPATLSGGERQRVAVARAIARRPAVLLLDEPLSALDARTRASAARLLGDVLRDVDVPAVLVTHDFSDAAALGDEVAVIDGGRVVQIGTAGELAATPSSAFVADFAGAVVLAGSARPAGDGTTIVTLDGGGELISTDVAEGRVAASVYPWEITIEADATPGVGSARNRLEATVVSVTAVGGRVRLGLMASQPLVAEVTETSMTELDLRPGVAVLASWKAAATRLLAA